MREDDVGRRLASSPEALLWQEVAGQIIPTVREVPLMPLALSGLISKEPLSLSTSITHRVNRPPSRRLNWGKGERDRVRFRYELSIE